MQYTKPEQEPKTIELDVPYSTRRLSKQRKNIVNSLNNRSQSNLWLSTINSGINGGGLRFFGYYKYSSQKLPLITVITVVYNGYKYLEQTIQSVINQTYNNIEYIIIDGGSTDGTIDRIRQYEGMIDFWISEPDKGIADAMNKGISLANGEYVIFIHSDDYFLSDQVIEKALLNINLSYDIVMFSVLFGESCIKIVPRKFNWWVNFKIPACHQGILCKLDLLRGLGGFDTKFKIDMDYDFLLRAYRKGIFVKELNLVLSVMRDTGISSRKDFKSIFERLSEERQVHDKNCPNVLMEIFYKVYWFFYLNYKRLMFLSN